MASPWTAPRCPGSVAAPTLPGIRPLRVACPCCGKRVRLTTKGVPRAHCKAVAA